MAGEIQYREDAHEIYEWRLQLKAEIAEKRRKRAEEEARLERERQIKLERQRVDRLLAEAIALRQSNDIRAYVEAARRANSEVADPVSPHEFEVWATWACRFSKLLDPGFSKAFPPELWPCHVTLMCCESVLLSSSW